MLDSAQDPRSGFRCPTHVNSLSVPRPSEPMSQLIKNCLTASIFVRQYSPSPRINVSARNRCTNIVCDTSFDGLA